MRINVLVISNKIFFISFKSSPLEPVIYYNFCKKLSSLVVMKKDRKEKRKYDVFASNGHNSQF